MVRARPDACCSSAPCTRCRMAPGSVCMPPSTSAGAASSAPTSNGRPASTTASSPRASASSSFSSAATIRAWRWSACTPITRACRPAARDREGQPVPDFAIHGAGQARAGRPRRAVRHREPRPDGFACHRRGGGGGAGAAKVRPAHDCMSAMEPSDRQVSPARAVCAPTCSLSCRNFALCPACCRGHT